MEVPSDHSLPLLKAHLLGFCLVFVAVWCLLVFGVWCLLFGVLFGVLFGGSLVV